MAIDMKDTLRAVVRDYIQEQHPEEIEELDEVFDDVYDTIERRLTEQSCEASDAREDELAFDASIITGTTISIACWVALAFIRAGLKDARRRDLPKLLDLMENKLASFGGNRELIHSIRARVEGILQEL